jgi:hypothetical protein
MDGNPLEQPGETPDSALKDMLIPVAFLLLLAGAVWFVLSGGADDPGLLALAFAVVIAAVGVAFVLLRRQLKTGLLVDPRSAAQMRKRWLR